MKKIAVFLVSCIGLGLFNYMPIKAETRETDVDIVEEFSILQEEIDSVLEISNGRYIYHPDEVKNVIEASKFDFVQFSLETNSNLTKESFTKQVLLRLETVNTEIVYSDSTCSIATRGTYCGRNANASGWNYVRKFTDKARSEKDAAALLAIYYKNMNDYQFDAIHAIQELVPSWAAIAMGLGSAGAAYETVYSLVLSTEIRHANYGSCGTVVDVNIFTKEISAWSQDTFYI